MEKYGTLLESDISKFLSLSDEAPVVGPPVKKLEDKCENIDSKCEESAKKEDFSDLEKYKKPLYILDLINSLECEDPDRFNTAYINSSSLILTNPVDLSNSVNRLALQELSEDADNSP